MRDESGDGRREEKKEQPKESQIEEQDEGARAKEVTDRRKGHKDDWIDKANEK